jgi:peptidoglycan/LPS O-acetylase OafA/YrhL
MRIPSLDGLRAVSIAMVLLSHALVSTTVRQSKWLPLLADGDLGVSVFFVISGFLITSLLLYEEHTTGRINLREFYLRRFFRIVPPFYAFLLAVCLHGT